MQNPTVLAQGPISTGQRVNWGGGDPSGLTARQVALDCRGYIAASDALDPTKTAIVGVSAKDSQGQWRDLVTFTWQGGEDTKNGGPNYPSIGGMLAAGDVEFGGFVQPVSGPLSVGGAVTGS